jgi:hypothetical protein
MAATSEDVLEVLKRIDVRLRVIEEALGVAYDDEGVLDPSVVKELQKREAERMISEDDFWRELGVED